MFINKYNVDMYNNGFTKVFSLHKRNSDTHPRPSFLLRAEKNKYVFSARGKKKALNLEVV